MDEITPASFCIFETTDLLITLNKENVFENLVDIRVSISQGSRQIDYGIDDVNIETNSILVHMSQSDTGKFYPGYANIQVNLLYNDGERDASSVGRVEILDNLYKDTM